ncbi:MAG TPA: hypothetical protein ENO19_09170, partial [Halothiobacillaceae bacterium]|nr:hypothetical protein [Halothiobacillaceae bacterium]
MNRQTDQSHQLSTLARFALALAGAALLLGAGFFAAKHQIWPFGALGETPEKAPTTQADQSARALAKSES